MFYQVLLRHAPRFVPLALPVSVLNSKQHGTSVTRIAFALLQQDCTPMGPSAPTCRCTYFALMHSEQCGSGNEIRLERIRRAVPFAVVGKVANVCSAFHALCTLRKSSASRRRSQPRHCKKGAQPNPCCP